MNAYISLLGPNSMPFWPGLFYATLVCLDSADRLAQLCEHRTTV